MLCLIAHVAVGAFTGLSIDEAHYALYATRLDWSYFDHPPLVGWAQWPAVSTGGSDLALRVVPAVAWLTASVLLHRFTLELARSCSALAVTDPHFARRAADGALLMWLLALMAHLLGIALVPDTLLAPIAISVTWLVWRMTHRADGTAARDAPPFTAWLMLGGLLGLGGLAKYNAILLVPGVVYVLVKAFGWRIAVTRGALFALGLAALAVAPVFWWNAQHDWISFAWQLEHGRGDQPWQPWPFARYLLAQVALYGALPVLAFVSLGRWLRTHDWPAALTVCLSIGLPGLLVPCIAAGRGAALPHWTAWAWLCLLPIAALGWTRLLRAWPGTVRTIGCMQGVLCVLVLLGAVVAIPANPGADLHGWSDAAARATALAREHHAARVAVSNWTLASRLAWYARPFPVVVVAGRQSQFDLWFGKPRDGDDALLVDWSEHSFAPPLRKPGSPGFASCRAVGTQAARAFGRDVSTFEFLLCRNWSGQG